MYLFKLEIVFVLLVSVDTEFMAPNQQFSKAFTSDWDKKNSEFSEVSKITAWLHNFALNFEKIQFLTALTQKV